jgi:hypothetical protein
MILNQNPPFPPEIPFPERKTGSPASAPPIPVIYEQSEIEQMSLRTYAAIQLRVPESGIDWLDKMIEHSRELDRETGRKGV